MNKKILYVVLGLIVIGAIAGGLIWRSRQQRTQAAGELRSALVERGALDVVVSASGSIEPARRSDLTFETGGRVVEVPVRIGDQVQEGDLLASLDRERLKLQVDQAEASVALAEAQLAKLEAGAQSEQVQASEANVRAAAAQADAAAAERDQVAGGARQADIAAAEAEVASALTQRKKAYDFHEQTLKCITIERSAGDAIEIGDGQVITLTEDFKRTFCPLLGVPEEQARYQLEAADEALEAARARLDQTKAGADQDQLAAAQANATAALAQRDAAQAQLDLLLEGATSEQVAATEASVEQAQASLRQAELALEKAALKAPFDGTVAAVDVTVGQQATPGLPAVTLVDLSQFHVTIAVDELDVAQLAAGQPVRLSFDALPNAVVTGTVKHIAAASAMDEGVVTYDVRIDLAPSDAPIRPDMTTSATIIVEEISDTLKIPTWAIHIDRNTGQYYVRRRTGDGIERADVKLGVRQEGVAQVLDGLSAGDEVVRSPETARFDFESGFGE